jgi:dienelactone hydrolase
MAIRSPGGAYLVATTVPADPLTAVLVLHGGPEHGTARCRWWLPQVLRCRLLAVAVTHQWPTAEQPAVYRLQHAWTGWDGDGRDPIADASWALAELGRRHPGIPVAILGHSMGGRVGVRLAGYPGVRGVVGLAPWLPSDDPVDQLAGVPVSVVQGTRDRELPATSTAEFLLRAHTAGALLAQIAVPGGGHAMIWRMRSWHRLAARQLAAILQR